MPLPLSLLAAATAGAALSAAGTRHDEPSRVIPTRYEAGHFYATPETVDGQTLRLVVDTGGGGGMGLYWLTADAAKRLHLANATCANGAHQPTVASSPVYKPGRGLPPPQSACGNVVMVNTQVDAKGIDGDGQLGAGFLPGQAWTFDYPARRLILEGSHWRADSRAHATSLGFPRDDAGHLQSGFARITLQVDGRPLEMLLDTGATAHPTTAGAKASGTPTVNGTGVTSYITTSMLEGWHHAHPDWRVVNKGDDLLGAKRDAADRSAAPADRAVVGRTGLVHRAARPQLPRFHVEHDGQAGGRCRRRQRVRALRDDDRLPGLHGVFPLRQRLHTGAVVSPAASNSEHSDATMPRVISNAPQPPGPSCAPTPTSGSSS